MSPENEASNAHRDRVPIGRLWYVSASQFQQKELNFTNFSFIERMDYQLELKI